MVAITFEEKMKRLLALTKASESEAKVLKDKIISLGKKTLFTSSQTTDAASFLAMAGFDVEKIRGSLAGVLDLSLAGGSDLGVTSDIASNILSGYSLKADEMKGIGNGKMS